MKKPFVKTIIRSVNNIKNKWCPQDKKEEAERERLNREEAAKRQAEELNKQQEKAAQELREKEQERINHMRLRLKYNTFAQKLLKNGMSEEETFAIISDRKKFDANFVKILRVIG